MASPPVHLLAARVGEFVVDRVAVHGYSDGPAWAAAASSIISSLLVSSTVDTGDPGYDDFCVVLGDAGCLKGVAPSICMIDRLAGVSRAGRGANCPHPTSNCCIMASACPSVSWGAAPRSS